MNEELARRAVACRHWRWMPGMRDLHFGRVIEVHDDEIVLHDCRVPAFAKSQPDSPDLNDPATIGCLLALVREAWDGAEVGIKLFADGFARVVITSQIGQLLFDGGLQASLAAALVAALEAKP